MTAPLKRDGLQRAFAEVGLASGDSVIIHSSCRSLGPVEGGADAVLDALLATIGPPGNLMLPTFNYSYPLPEPYYDPAATPCRTGIIPELGRQRPNAVRSLHPSHSVAVIGPDAEALTRDHLACRALGVGSPADRLAQMGGKVLLIGVTHRADSMIHVAEEHAQCPKLKPWAAPPTPNVLMPGGRLVPHALDTSTSCSAGFDVAEEYLRERGVIRYGRAGDAVLQLMVARDVIRHIVALLGDSPEALLCSRPECKSCAMTREHLRNTD